MINTNNIISNNHGIIYQSLNKFEESAQALGRKFVQIIQPAPMDAVSIADRIELTHMAQQFEVEAKDLQRDIKVLTNPLVEISAELRYGFILNELYLKVHEVGLEAIKKEEQGAKAKLEMINASHNLISIADTLEFQMQIQTLREVVEYTKKTEDFIHSLRMKTKL